MRALREFGALTRATGSLWLRRLPLLSFWLCIGWALRELLVVAGAMVSGKFIVALLVFVLGFVVWVVALVLMLHSVTSEMECLKQIDDDPTLPPLKVYDRQQVIVEATLPFLGAYAAWGFTEAFIRRAFSANVIYHGGAIENFSLSFAGWKTYLVASLVVWAIQQVFDRVRGERGGVALAFVSTYLKSAALLTAFMSAGFVWAPFTSWLESRVFWVKAGQWKEQLFALLPDWQNYWRHLVPDGAEALIDKVYSSAFQGLFGFAVMPLVWLAITAIVVGWTDFKKGISGEELDEQLAAQTERVRRTRLGGALITAEEHTPLAMVREKIVGPFVKLRPAAQAFRLILQAGPLFLAAYLLLGVLVRLVQPWLLYALQWLAGPAPFETQIVYEPLLRLVSELVGWTLSVSFYAAAFDHAMLKALDAHRRPRRVAEPDQAGLTTESAPRRIGADS